MSESTLTEVLASLGYVHEPRASESLNGRRVLKNGSIAFEGSAHECWEWLRTSGQIKPARDPKHSPVDGDVIDNGDGWVYTVDRFGLDEKRRSIVDYTIRCSFQGEARQEKRKASLGAWRHLHRQAEEIRQAAQGSDRSAQDRSESCPRCGSTSKGSEGAGTHRCASEPVPGEVNAPGDIRQGSLFA